MRLFRIVAGALVLCVMGSALVPAQDEPLPAGSEGVPVPKKRKHVQPVYPPDALAQGIRGIVILDLVIDTQGRVAEVGIIRSIPGLDEAAVAAARQWEYEVTRKDGQPVSVRLTVPITFALKLPDVSRQEGIPELRQGVTPKWPQGASSGGYATADVTLDPDGRVGVARILEGEEPWAGALLEALRTWRFSAPPPDTSVSFRVEAAFANGGDEEDRRVALRLNGLRQSQHIEESPAAHAELVPNDPPGPGSLAGEEPAADAEDDSTGDESPPEEEESAAEAASAPPRPPDELADEAEPAEPASAERARPEEGPSEEAGVEPADATGAPSAEASDADADDEAPPPEDAPSRVAQATPAPTPAGPAPGPAGAGEATPAPLGETEADPAAPPPIEVITAAPPPLPPENGVSALVGVTLEPGVPDLTTGRRPVAPPLARMAGASGGVEVDFSVGAGGITVVGDVRGPEILQAAARAAVETWSFRRTRANRLYLTAVFTYDEDAATAVVRPQPAP